ncbi:FMN-binding domain protein [Desulfitobacterium hafniense DCB-2]|uniref:FMN-binding domain protein n=1 Tax=Desulfitobacterium hafniense (strain DSM 10664 / DCB-2) TaxID=272564 RepID=B8FZT8_DESHD|nr:FMN-binding protein [Desulfitobacterium hafniense]ACL19162.1 FMN-binding domain protein [Desulfitobacterium hafniense DCB-2]
MKKIAINKIVAMILSVACLISVVGCSAESGADSSKKSGYQDGTYEGISPNGIGGEIAVAVEIAGGKIANVKVTSHGETEGIGTLAVDQLPGKIVEAQSTEVDGISGASVSSAAIKEAVNDALIKAK